MQKSSYSRLNPVLWRLLIATVLTLCHFRGGLAQEKTLSKPATKYAPRATTRAKTPPKSATPAKKKSVPNKVAGKIAAKTGAARQEFIKEQQRARQRINAVARAQRQMSRSEDGQIPLGLTGTNVAERARHNPLVLILYIALYSIVTLISLYAARHYWFTVNRLLGKQRHPYIDIDAAAWPPVTVFIAAHNEEDVIDQILDALLQVDYSSEKLRIIPVNDRSTDRTKEIIEEWVAHYPERIEPFHRTGGAPGKAAALKDATEITQDDIILVFDADYIPGRGLIKQLVSPFFDPEVGAVMGRVVPWNIGSNLLVRLLDLERSGGYQVDQQARMNMRLVPQYGGTVGGVRKSALMSVGGWRINTLSEDTDMTYNMLLAGWKTIYQNRSECYEEVPEEWPVRIRQIMRWAKGHNQAWARYSWPLFWNRNVSWRERLDGLLLLGVFVMSPLVLLGWMLALLLFYMGENPYLGALAVLAVASYSALGNFAAFFEIAAAARLDGYQRRIRLLPLNALGFLVSLISTSHAGMQQITPSRRGRTLHWDKTQRFRTVPERSLISHLDTTPILSSDNDVAGEKMTHGIATDPGTIAGDTAVITDKREQVSL